MDGGPALANSTESWWARFRRQRPAASRAVRANLVRDRSGCWSLLAGSERGRRRLDSAPWVTVGGLPRGSRFGTDFGVSSGASCWTLAGVGGGPATDPTTRDSPAAT